MAIVLILIIALHIKNNMLYDDPNFSYLYAFAAPFIVLTAMAAFVIFQRYLYKLRQSHPTVFATLLTILVVFSLCVAAFSVLFALYLDKPSESATLLEISLAPYYVALLLWTGFFTYISPGLLDNVNGIPTYQFVVFALYTLMFIVYPILFYTVVLPEQ